MNLFEGSTSTGTSFIVVLDVFIEVFEEIPVIVIFSDLIILM